MTLKEFAAWSVGYYGPWPKGQQEDIAEYLSSLAPSYLDALQEVLKKTFTSQYGKVPDVAAFEAVKWDAIDIQDDRRPNVLQIEDTRDGRETSELMDIDWMEAFWDTVTRNEKTKVGLNGKSDERG